MHWWLSSNKRSTKGLFCVQCLTCILALASLLRIWCHCDSYFTEGYTLLLHWLCMLLASATKHLQLHCTILGSSSCFLRVVLCWLGWRLPGGQSIEGTEIVYSQYRYFKYCNAVQSFCDNKWMMWLLWSSQYFFWISLALWSCSHDLPSQYLECWMYECIMPCVLRPLNLHYEQEIKLKLRVWWRVC